MIDPAGLAQYEQVVSALMSQDNAVRSQAEDAFNQLKQQPDVFFSGLIQLARQNANEQIRSLSAVLLRRVIGQTQPARDGEPAGVSRRAHGERGVAPRGGRGSAGAAGRRLINRAEAANTCGASGGWRRGLLIL